MQFHKSEISVLRIAYSVNDISHYAVRNPALSTSARLSGISAEGTHYASRLTHHVSVGQNTIAYRHIPSKVPTILILHGWGSSSNAWGRDIEILREAGFGVIIPDLPGFGESPAPVRAWGVDDYSGLVLRFLQALDVHPAVIVGHSFGGRVAIRLLLQSPEIAKGLLLCASSGLKKKRTRKQEAQHFIAKVGGPIFSVYPFSKVHSLARRLLYRSIGEYDYYRAAGTMRDTFKRVIDEDIAVEIKKLHHPTLIVWGDQDNVTPIGDAYRFHQLIKGSRVEVIEGVGHRLYDEQPEKFCKFVIDFVREIDS